MVITLILCAVGVLPRDLSTTGTSLISLFEVVCQNTFQFARETFVCILEHARTHLKSKMHFPGHFRSQSIYTTYSCSTHTTFALSSQQNPLLSISRGTQWILSSFHGAIDTLTGEVQWGCVADCSWSLFTAPTQFAHQMVILHSWWEGKNLQELKVLDMHFKFVYFLKVWSCPYNCCSHTQTLKPLPRLDQKIPYLTSNIFTSQFRLTLPSPALAEFVTGRSSPATKSLTDLYAYMRLREVPTSWLNTGLHISSLVLDLSV